MRALPGILIVCVVVLGIIGLWRSTRYDPESAPTDSSRDRVVSEEPERVAAEDVDD